MAADIRKMLNISIGNVSKETADWLNADGVRAANYTTTDDPAPHFHMARHAYGWMVWVYDADEQKEWADDDVPQAVVQCLVPLFRHAKKHGCEWINFDCDASVDWTLPVYEW